MKALPAALAASVMVLFAMPGAASAATIITVSANPVTPNDNGPLFAGSGVSLGSSTGYVTPTQKGADPNDAQGWDPWGSTDTNSFWISVGGAGGNSGSSQSLVFSSAVTSFSLLWGSPNSDNSITLSNGDVVSYQDSSGYFVDGVQQTSAYPNTTDPGYIVTITSSTPFSSVILSNDIGGFEVADIGIAGGAGGVSGTPLPSTWTMLIAGFLGLGVFAYRGSKKNAAARAAA